MSKIDVVRGERRADVRMAFQAFLQHLKMSRLIKGKSLQRLKKTRLF